MMAEDDSDGMIVVAVVGRGQEKRVGRKDAFVDCAGCSALQLTALEPTTGSIQAPPKDTSSERR